MCEEYEKAFKEALNNPQSGNTKLLSEKWRSIGRERLYMDAKKLANVRRVILKKSGLTSGEIEEIKRTGREADNSEKQNPEDVTVRMENMTPGCIKDTVKQVR